MSHTVTVNMIADQEIDIGGRKVNIHDIKSIFVDSQGKIIDAYLEPEQPQELHTGWLFEEKRERG